MGQFKKFLIESEKGTYVGGRLSTETSNKLIELTGTLGIDNVNDEIHTTILYSTKPCPKYKELGEVSYKSKFGAFTIFSGETNVLVIKLDSEDLINRHKELMKEHDASYDFPEYVPHVTLAYDVNDFKVSDISEEMYDEFSKLNYEIVFEYGEVLNTDWKNKEE